MSVVHQVPRYIGVAGLSAASDWVVFLGLTWAGVGPLPAQSVSRVLGGLVSFVANKVWTYDAGGTRQTHREAVRFGVLYAFSFALSLGILAGWMAWIGRLVPLGKGVADGVCFVVNFVVMRRWVFADPPRSAR